MHGFVEIFKEGLYSWGELIEALLNTISLLFIVIGVIFALTKAIRQRKSYLKTALHIHFRMWFGGWLIVALQFQLAADIVGTIIAPTNENLIQLAVVAIIRIFLNYFLNKELKEQYEFTQAGIEQK